MNNLETQLPLGHNDESSPYFIPVNLREAYSQVKQSSIVSTLPNHTSRVIDREAQHSALDRLGEDAHPIELAKLTDDLARDFEQASYLAYTSLAQHELKLAKAWEIAERNERYESDRLKRVESFRCPVCLISDEAQGGAIIDRILPTGEHRASGLYASPLPSITSCIPCWSTARQLYVESVSSIRFDGRKTRKDLVEQVVKALY